VAQETATEALEDHTPGIVNTIKNSGTEKTESVLLIQIFTAADYYTWNQTLMENVPPVWVDIILDPFILNVFPRSLLPTAGYLVVLAVAAWYMAKFIAQWLMVVARIDEKKKDV